MPEAQGDNANPNDSKLITLLIDKQGNYFISTKSETGQLTSRKLEAANLKRELAAISGKNEKPFVISADGQTPHQAVIHALDLAGQVGFRHIAFATKEPTE